MPNRMHFDGFGPERELLLKLDPETFGTLLEALHYILNDPTGGRTEEIYYPPVVIHYYEDGHWRISFGLGKFRSN